MLKLFMIISLFLSNLLIEEKDYCYLDKIECNLNKHENINLYFRFNSDNYKEHNLQVFIDVFNEDNELIRKFENELIVKGNVQKKANLDYPYQINNYLLVTVKYNDYKLASNIRIDLIDNEDCNLNKDNTSCNFKYQKEYKNGIINDKYSSFKIVNGYFDTYLVNNNLDLNNFKIYSLYDLTDLEIILIIHNKISEFNLNYDNGYIFNLASENHNNIYSFSLLEDYYVNLKDFEFSEDSNKENLKVNQIYFPFTDQLKEYNCSIIIKGVNNIKIDFNVTCLDKLFGDCSNSKYCLEVKDYA